MNLGYKDIKFILLALKDYKAKLKLESLSKNEDIVSEAGNDYLFVQSLISKLKNEI